MIKIHIPETVKIAGCVYSVDREEKSFVNGSNVVDGTHSFFEQKIKVVREGTEEYQSVVFLHELMHGIIENYCPNIVSAADEEKLVEQISKGLFQVVTDNPEIFKEVKSVEHS